MTKKKTDINKYIEEAHQNAINQGWWDNPKSFGETIALIHSELSEALEEHRNHRKPTETYYSGKATQKLQDGTITNEIIAYYGTPEGRCILPDNLGFDKDVIETKKPEGIPSELADVVIRVFDMCGYYGIDLEAAIKEKMAYNKTRPFKHGGKKL